MTVSAAVDALFQLPADHPGVHDRSYRQRRGAIAAVAERFRPGDPIPDVRYTPEEDAVWATVSRELQAKHRRHASRAYLDAAARIHLATTRVPQLREVDDAVRELTGFRIEPVPGLVPTRVFYGALARRAFLSTQYIRHHSVPYYTPEPDIVHEVIGHATMLADPTVADLYEAAGHASLRARSDRALDVFSRVFWFTIEFGVVHEDGALKTYGAGLLSSYGEIEVFARAEIRPWDLAAMATLDYDITHYQPVLFAAESFDRMVEDLHRFFADFDDDAADRLVSTRGGTP